jgi:linoleoyl-CoA desaturase
MRILPKYFNFFMTKISFNNTNKQFSSTLRKRVNDYFKTHNISNTGNRRLYLKSAILVSTAVAGYLILVFFTPPIWLSIILCMLFGFNLAAIGFNIMHDGGHQSFSKKAWVNAVTAYSLNMLGATIYFWKQKHNISHHTFTNVDGHDHRSEVYAYTRRPT